MWWFKIEKMWIAYLYGKVCNLHAIPSDKNILTMKCNHNFLVEPFKIFHKVFMAQWNCFYELEKFQQQQSTSATTARLKTEDAPRKLDEILQTLHNFNVSVPAHVRDL